VTLRKSLLFMSSYLMIVIASLLAEA
jgi:hypothetical protein